MGYRFKLEHANVIAHLVEGNILAFIDEIVLSEDKGNEYLYVLKMILDDFEKDSYSGLPKNYLFYRRQRISNIQKSITRLLEAEYISDFPTCDEWLKLDIISKRNFLMRKKQLQSYLRILQDIHNLLGRFHFRTLIIPKLKRPHLDRNENDFNNILLSEALMEDLVKFYPRDSCLILQPKEEPWENQLSVYNAFGGMKLALKDMDLWPGVLVWNRFSQMEFIPTQSTDSLYELYEAIHISLKNDSDGQDFTPIYKLRNKKEKPSTFFIHMSDLHFGNSSSDFKGQRLLELIDNEKRMIQREYSEKVHNYKIYPLITGDLLESPKKSYEKTWNYFKRELCGMGMEKPIFVLGNHDYNRKGLNIFDIFRKDKVTITSLMAEPIETINDIKLAIIKIDSNIAGDFAQGQVGEEQMLFFREEITKYKQAGYNTLALLHHHPIKFEEPNWYKGNWVRRSLGYERYEQTLALKDANDFLTWAREMAIPIILHGHRHIPHIELQDDLRIIACGSSTGKINHKEQGKTYLSYNLLKYVNNSFVYCISKYEDVIGNGAQHLDAVYF